MSGSKHFDRVAVIVTAWMLVLTILFMNGAALGIEAMAHTMGYEGRLFDNTKVHTVDIVMNDWDELIANATSEEYYTANVVIDGESYKNVGIRAKGNTSLSTVASLGSERYSFKIEFDRYDSTKSYHGLDKLSLNNLIQDSTMMKDYLTYTMMNEFNVNSPLCSYVYITVNGEDWGLYLAVEGVEESFLERNYGSDYGELYKPDSMSFGTFQGGSGQSTVNTPIDSPISGGLGEDRPMWSWILSDEAYTELYHQYFAEFLNSVDIQGIIDNAYNLIKSYVEKDPTAFFTYEEFELGVEALRQFCGLRSESISMQLKNGETTENMRYVDASSLTLSDMGSMNGGMGGFGGDQSGRPDNTDGFDGEMPEGFDSSNRPEGFSGDFPGQFSGDRAAAVTSDGSDTAGDTNTNHPSGGNMQMPGGDFNFDMNGSADSSSNLTGWIWIAASVLVLGAGLIIVKKFK